MDLPRHWLFILTLIAIPYSGIRAAPYPAAPPEFAATIDGKPLELHEFTQGKFALFELAHPAEVELRTGFDVRWVDVRPKSAGVTATIGPDHNTVRLRMTRPVPLTLEFNEDLTRAVHLFAYAPEIQPPRAGDPGVRFFGPGIHEAGQIELRDGETLYLAPGAWVMGTVRSVGTKNIRICGRGVLDGTEIGGPDTALVVQPGTIPFRNLIYFQDTEGARIEGITLFNCHHPHWSPLFGTVFVTTSTGTRISGVRILNPSLNYCDDGFDIVSSSHVLIEDVFVRTRDDCIAVKNMADRDTHDIAVRRAIIWDMLDGGNGLEIGFEIRGHPVHDVRFEDIDIIHVERSAAISIHNGDTGAVEDITYDDIRVEDAPHRLIDFAVLYSQGSVDRPSDDAENTRRLDVAGAWDGLLRFTPEERAERARFRGTIARVRVKNMRIIGGGLAYSVIAGFDDIHGIQDVSFEGLSYLGRPILNPAEGRFAIEHAANVVFK
jgi:hypothetical protein